MRAARSFTGEVEPLRVFGCAEYNLASSGSNRVSAVLVEKIFGVPRCFFSRPAVAPKKDFGGALALEDVVPDLFGATAIYKDVGVEVSGGDAVGAHGVFRLLDYEQTAIATDSHFTTPRFGPTGW